MKFALALLALVATASALPPIRPPIELPNFGRGELYKDIQDFIDVLPQEEIYAITAQYVAEDTEFKAMIQYLKSEEFKGLVKDVEALHEIKVLMDYIHHAGIDIYQIVNLLNAALGLDPLTPPDFAMNTKQITGGIRGYIDDIKAVLPMDVLNKMYKNKLETSPEFAKFVEQLQSDNFQEIVNQVYLNPKFQELLEHADKAGVDLQAIKDLLKILWGIHIPPRPHTFYIKN
ncbi:protein G12-like [Polyergus mexicanus]|uniref:protein G12-like n=1 Tax=Polyergus mexicanus TaxID=615972 RepID=UPI0038B6722B